MNESLDIMEKPETGEARKVERKKTPEETRVEEIHTILSERAAADDHEARNAMIDFIEQFRNKFDNPEGDFDRYRLYHILCGSTPRNYDDRLDEEGNQEILRFVDKLARDYDLDRRN